MLAALDKHHLVFWTTCVDSLRLGTPAPQGSDARLKPKNPPLRYNFLDSSPKNVGTLLLDGGAPHSLGDRHLFMVISEAQYYGLDLEPKVDGYPLYNVMLGEWVKVELRCIDLDWNGWIRKTGEEQVLWLKLFA
jgi:hypothetical protein